MENYELQKRVSKMLDIPSYRVLSIPFVDLIDMLCDRVEVEQAKLRISEDIIETVDKFLNQERGY